MKKSSSTFVKRLLLLVFFGYAIGAWQALAYGLRIVDCRDFDESHARKACEEDLSVAGALSFGSETLNFYESRYGIAATPQCVTGASLADLKDQIETALDEAAALLGRAPPEFMDMTRLSLFVTSDARFSHAFRSPPGRSLVPFLFFPCHVVRHRRAPVIHEFGHLLLPQFGAMSLREGISDHLQFALRPGRPASFVDGKAAYNDVCLIRKLMTSETPRLLDRIGAFGAPKFRSPQERRDFYEMSRSFVTFMASRYGLAAVAQVAADSSLPYASKLGRDRNDLLHAWVDHVRSHCSLRDGKPHLSR